MEGTIKEMVERIRELREISGYTEEELAAELGIDVETYKSYEAHGDDIPISVIFGMANLFGVGFNDLVSGESGKLNTYQIIRKGSGRITKRHPGYLYKDLAFRYGNKIMQPLLVNIEPNDKTYAVSTHQGEEFNMVLNGTIRLIFDDEEILLHEGDSIYFNATHPHRQCCVGETPATMLVVIAD